MAATMEAPLRTGTLKHPRIPFCEIREPGTYINMETGSLFRVPEDALNKGHSPVMDIVSKTGPVCYKLCDDPWVPINKARLLAADADIQINF